MPTPPWLAISLRSLPDRSLRQRGVGRPGRGTPLVVAMRIVSNTGTDRVVDLIRPWLQPGNRMDLASEALSLHAFGELAEKLARMAHARLVLPPGDAELGLFGADADRAARNRLQGRWLASRCADWVEKTVEIRRAERPVPQGSVVLRNGDGSPRQAVLGSFSFSTDGLGLAPGNPFNLIQASDTAEESERLCEWFDGQWDALPADDSAKTAVVDLLRSLAVYRDPLSIYALILHHLFRTQGDELDEEQVVKSATGIRNTAVWKKLYKFQRDGCGGSHRQAQPVRRVHHRRQRRARQNLRGARYHQVPRVAQRPCPRPVSEAPARQLDTLLLQRSPQLPCRRPFQLRHPQPHRPVARRWGFPGDIDLAYVNWGNYDLVVIDESHNFRNKRTPRQGGETRYDRLMRRIIHDGVKTRVLMLSATPVNNRLADLRNQIAFVTEGDDAALIGHGIDSIDATTRLAQKQFNRWLDLDDSDRTPRRLIEMLGFDYFTMLDRLTIARSRKHIEKYYGTTETGRFPERLRPINLKPDVDPRRSVPLHPRHQPGDPPSQPRCLCPATLRVAAQAGGVRRQVQHQARTRRGVLPAGGSRGEPGTASSRQRAEAHGEFRHLLCAHGAAPTRSRGGHSRTHLRSRPDELEEIDIADVDIEDPAFESLLVGRKVKVLLQDVDQIRWRQDLIEDRNRLATLHAAACQVTAARDAKLAELRAVIERKCRCPINPDNRKVIVFTAFADTARYLYEELAPWAGSELGLEAALVTGTGGNQTTLPRLRKDLVSILTAFAPRTKERPDEFSAEGELDLLIATDCISEGQNLQDCDWLINYDIHWNPVRIIQRFGRIDRIGAPNERIQLVNFWPNLELEEYLRLEQRVSGRMVLLDISATGEENLIHQQSGDPMNDLEYRRSQLLKLQDAVIDLEDLSSAVSIADLTLTDFRIDLADYLRDRSDALEHLPLGVYAVTTTTDAETPPGTIFCLRAEGRASARSFEPGYPLAPHYLVHVGEDGAVLLPFTQAKQILDRFRRLCLGRDMPDAGACARFDQATRGDRDMRHAQRLLAAAVASVAGKHEERAVASLFSPGGTHALAGEFSGINDFEVVAFLIVLAEEVE